MGFFVLCSSSLDKIVLPLTLNIPASSRKGDSRRSLLAEDKFSDFLRLWISAPKLSFWTNFNNFNSASWHSSRVRSLDEPLTFDLSRFMKWRTRAVIEPIRLDYKYLDFLELLWSWWLILTKSCMNLWSNVVTNYKMTKLMLWYYLSFYYF